MFVTARVLQVADLYGGEFRPWNCLPIGTPTGPLKLER
jgi:hypothetical protein